MRIGSFLRFCWVTLLAVQRTSFPIHECVEPEQYVFELQNSTKEEILLFAMLNKKRCLHPARIYMVGASVSATSLLRVLSSKVFVRESVASDEVNMCRPL